MEMTDAAILPDDIKIKLLAIRDALLKEDINEAYHILYTIADPTFSSFDPWKLLEPESNKLKSLNEEA